MRITSTVLAALFVLMTQVVAGQVLVGLDGTRVSVIPASASITACADVEGEGTPERPPAEPPRSGKRAEPVVPEESCASSVASAPQHPPAYYPRRLQPGPRMVDPESAH